VFGLGQGRPLEVGFGNGAKVRRIDGGCDGATRIWGRKMGLRRLAYHGGEGVVHGEEGCSVFL
jgi:hypothetical protein